MNFIVYNKYYEKIGFKTKDITDEIPFEIPNNWEWVRLKNIVTINTGKKDVNYGNPSGIYPFFTCAAEPTKCDNYSFTGKSLILPGNGANVGLCILYEGKFEAYQRTYVLQGFLNYLDYLKFLLDLEWKKYNADRMYGSAMPYIKLGNIEQFLVPLPPLSEQERIVSEIEKIFARIDIVKENQDALEKLKEGLKNKILDLAIKGKLVEQDPNDEPASVLLEKIKAEKTELVKQGKIKKDKQESYIFKGPDNRHYEKIGSETKDITDEIPFEIPNSWQWARLGNIINLKSGRDLTPDCYSDIEINNCVPYITGASNIENEQVIINRWTSKPQTLAYKGDLLLTCKGTVGLLAFLQCEKAHIARQIMSLNVFTCIDIFYLKFFISSYIAELQRKAKSMIPGISRDDILQTLCPIPPFKEQHKIVKKIEMILNIIDEL